MAKTDLLLALARRLEAAATAGDWSALRSADADVRALLKALAGARGAADRAALTALRSAHAAAMRRCAEASQRLEERLDDMQQRREGWMAYAMSGAALPQETR
jgi:hypothetical protein